MCMDNGTGIRISGTKKLDTPMIENALRVDERNAYISGKAIPKELWREQAYQLSLQPDIYLDIAALAGSSPGSHSVRFGNQTFLVDVGEVVQSEHGRYRLVTSIKPYTAKP